MATQVNDSNFDAVVLQSQLPVLVDFWAPWCGPCRAIGPIIDELANEYEGKLSVVKLNVDEMPLDPRQVWDSRHSLPLFFLRTVKLLSRLPVLYLSPASRP